MNNMSEQELLSEMRSDSLLNRVRRAMTDSHGRIEQAEAQRKKPTIFEVRRMEFEAARKILDLVATDLRRELLSSTANSLEEGYMRVILDRVCPEHHVTTSPSTTSS